MGTLGINATAELTPITVDHQGIKWTLYKADNEPTIRDIDWAERLGFERPRDIRELIKRMAKAGRLGEVACRTVRHPGSKAATEFYLTKAQALKVAAKSETTYADELLDQMIQVFLLATGQAQVAVGAAPKEPRWSGGDEVRPVAGQSARQILMALLAQQDQLDAVERQQAQVSQRLAVVENKQRAAAEEIASISPSQPELPTISKRQLIREHVNRYAAAMNMYQQDVWRLLYHHVDRRLGTRVYGYTLAKGETKLDRLEKLGLLDKVGKVCDTDLQIPAERQRHLAAPASHEEVYHA